MIDNLDRKIKSYDWEVTAMEWYIDGDRHTYYFLGSSLVAIVYPMDDKLWRWEFRYGQESSLIRCGVRHSFEAAKDAAITMVRNQNEQST